MSRTKSCKNASFLSTSVCRVFVLVPKLNFLLVLQVCHSPLKLKVRFFNFDTRFIRFAFDFSRKTLLLPFYVIFLVRLCDRYSLTILFYFQVFYSCCDFLVLSFVMPPNPWNLCNRTPRFAISFFSCPIYVLAILSLSGCFFYRYPLIGARTNSNHITTQLFNHKLNCKFSSSSHLSS